MLPNRRCPAKPRVPRALPSPLTEVTPPTIMPTIRTASVWSPIDREYDGLRILCMEQLHQALTKSPEMPATD